MYVMIFRLSPLCTWTEEHACLPWSVVLNEAEVDQSLSANSMAGHMFAMIAKLHCQTWFI